MKRTISLIAAAAATTLSIAACGGSTAYPANVQSNFLNSCEATGGTTSTCGCALSHIEARVSLSDFQTGEQALESGGSVPRWATKAVAGCA